HVGAAHAADGVDLVDEKQTQNVLFRRLEHIANPAGADADEHLDEFRAADRKEWHAHLTGDGAGQQRFAGPQWTDQQHAFGNLRAQLLKLFKAAQKIDHFLQLAFNILHIDNVVESDAR